MVAAIDPESVPELLALLSEFSYGWRNDDALRAIEVSRPKLRPPFTYSNISSYRVPGLDRSTSHSAPPVKPVVENAATVLPATRTSMSFRKGGNRSS